MFCPYCGAQNEDAANTCKECQKPLPKPEEERKEKEKPVYNPPPVRPFQPGSPGSEYVFAAPVNYSSGYVYQPASTVGVAQSDSIALARLGAYIIDSIITGVISLVVVVIPLVFWVTSFVSRYYSDLEATCNTSRDTVACDNLLENIMVEKGELWGFLGVVGGFGLLATLLCLAYSVYFTARGATPGKKVFGIKVVRQDGSTPGFGAALLRQTVGYFISSTVFMLGFLWAVFDKYGQGWHDKLAKTYVVKA
ncbi:MAG: RDD family protein [Chloroflexi bacterium]|uniref:RDD family protein n=1 Tax=Candidatus Chlorohelix allophototropha TaxID=3003348 RepID=A0A8T7LXG8_9CHLR|nr:RDD family protein [Chloroflexota bacterium]WJW66024.1 RDD family protein [Chloroflexota bacterium L227-S17]